MLFTAILVLRGGIACSQSDENFREDVFDCENAIAHIQACCPGTNAPPRACVNHYVHETTNCGCYSGDAVHEEKTWPVLGLTASKAILAASCEELAAGEGCASLQDQIAKPNSSTYDSACSSNDEEYL